MRRYTTSYATRKAQAQAQKKDAIVCTVFTLAMIAFMILHDVIKYS